MSRESSEIFYTPKKFVSSQEFLSPEENEIPEEILKSKLESTGTGFDEESLHDIIVSLLNLDHLSEY